MKLQDRIDAHAPAPPKAVPMAMRPPPRHAVRPLAPLLRDVSAASPVRRHILAAHPRAPAGAAPPTPGGARPARDSRDSHSSAAAAAVAGGCSSRKTKYVPSQLSEPSSSTRQGRSKRFE